MPSTQVQSMARPFMIGGSSISVPLSHLNGGRQAQICKGKEEK